MLVDFLLLLAGIVVVAKFSSVVADAAVTLSRITGISKTVIGFIFIGLGTSLPELSIGVISSLENHGTLSVGNLLGANITNLTLILGLMAFIGFNIGNIYSLKLRQTLAATAGISFILIYMGSAGLLFGLFLLCIYYIFSTAIIKDGFVAGEKTDTAEAVKAAIKLIVSVAIVVTAAYVTTETALRLAASLGVADSIIGATIISIGTTMPELGINVAAVRKRNISLAIGDTIGTIISNLALILGIVTMINPVVITADIIVLGIMSIAVCSFVYLLSLRQKFGIKEAVILVSMYIIYILSLLVIEAFA